MPSEAETPDLALIEATARKFNKGRSEDHIKSVALDALSIFRALTAASAVRSEGVAAALYVPAYYLEAIKYRRVSAVAAASEPNEVCDTPLYTSPVQTREDDDPDAAYELGKRDGYEQAVQDIDVLTGGDGEYRFCTDHDPERHTPDAATMKQRIADRFALLSQPEPKGDKT